MKINKEHQKLVNVSLISKMIGKNRTRINWSRMEEKYKEIINEIIDFNLKKIEELRKL